MVRQTSAVQKTSLQETGSDRQFQRFLEAADRLGPHLTNDGFAKVLTSLVVCPLEPEGRGRTEKATIPGQPASSLPFGLPLGTIAPTQRPKLKDSLSTTPPGFTPKSAPKTDVSSIARLHFVEAMMMLLFNALDEKQDAVKDGFGSLLKKVENLEILGAPPAHFKRTVTR